MSDLSPEFTILFVNNCLSEWGCILDAFALLKFYFQII